MTESEPKITRNNVARALSCSEAVLLRTLVASGGIDLSEAPERVEDASRLFRMGLARLEAVALPWGVELRIVPAEVPTIKSIGKGENDEHGD